MLWKSTGLQRFLPMPPLFDPLHSAIEFPPDYADPTNLKDSYNPDKTIQGAHNTKLPPNLRVL